MTTIRAVYPGTFDPVHNGHIDIISRAALLFHHVIVGVYSHERAIKPVLFSVEERLAMIEEALNGHENVTIVPFSGLTAHFADSVGAQVIVRGLRVFSDFEFEFRMAIANRRLVPGLDQVTLMTREENMFLSSTIVREIASLQGDVSSMVPPHVAAALAERFKRSA